MKLVFLYLILINAVGFVFMLADKQKARKNQWRIPERVLMGFAVFGGSFGVLLGMYFCRHKTRHLKFTLGVPMILAIQIVLIILLWMQK